jgi:hypothetical protein
LVYELCLEIIEWISSWTSERWDTAFKGGTQTTCKFCDEVLKRPKQAIFRDKTSEPDSTICVEVQPRRTEPSGEIRLNSEVDVLWIVIVGRMEIEWIDVSFALWTKKGRLYSFAHMIIFN